MNGDAPEIVVARGKIPIEVDTSKWDAFVRKANLDLDALERRMKDMGFSVDLSELEKLSAITQVIEGRLGNIQESMENGGDE